MDHTTRPLSPRVLDRASVVDVMLDEDRIVSRAALTLTSEQLEAIKDLNFRLADVGASFSLRTAYSLKECLARRSLLGLEPWGVLDRVLVQEVLAKVKLLAGDPSSKDLCGYLSKWSEDYGSSMPQCAAVIGKWSTALEQDRDVQ